MSVKRQKIVKLIGESLNEVATDTSPRSMKKVPGLKVVTHSAGGNRYLSLQHEKSKKYLVKSLHVTKIRPTIELAAHFFGDYDFTKSHEHLSKNATYLYGAVQAFRKEVERIHQPVEELPKFNSRKKKTTKKK